MTRTGSAIWEVTPEKLREAVRRLVEAADPVCILLLGSRARGDADEHSDVDLLVIERDVQDRYAELRRLSGALSGLVLPVDLLVISEKEYREWSQTPGSIYRAARQEGQVLYEAA
jgi:predicted nucleotidyltransferase